MDQVVALAGVRFAYGGRAVLDDLDLSVATGESDLVLTLISEILPEPGVELAGPLPSDFQTYLGFSAAPSPNAARSAGVGAFIKFLRGNAAAAAYKAKGMEATR